MGLVESRSLRVRVVNLETTRHDQTNAIVIIFGHLLLIYWLCSYNIMLSATDVLFHPCGVLPFVFYS